MPPSVKHEYKRLENAASQIRLLEISHDSDERNGPTIWRLSTFDFARAPPYHAISYTWGPEQPTEDIDLDRRSKSVRKNCADVLRQLAHFRSSRYYWLDALCINQADNMEKSAQVAMMGEIFRIAEQVLICLDKRDDDGEYALQAISRQVHIDEEPGSQEWRAAVLNRNGIPAGVDIQRFGRSLSLLSQRSYFKRVWVVQEISLARNASICCGTTKIPAHHLLEELSIVDAGLLFLRTYRTVEDLFTRDRHPSTFTNAQLDLLNDTFHEMRRNFNRTCDELLFSYNSPTRSPKNRKWKIDESIALTSGLECLDPRDTVYAVLALIDWEGLNPVVPDYAKSRYDLAKQMHLMRLPVHTVVKLMRNLAIDEHSPEIIKGLHLRQERLDIDLMKSIVPSSIRVSSKNKIEQICQGCQLTVFNDIARREIMLPRGTRPGDWLLESQPANLYINVRVVREYLVVRGMGDVFAFLGRALCPPSLYHQQQFDANDVSCEQRFRVWFDTDDLMVLTATQHPALDPETIVRTRVCSAPGSSFAMCGQARRSLRKDRYSIEVSSLNTSLLEE